MGDNEPQKTMPLYGERRATGIGKWKGKRQREGEGSRYLSPAIDTQEVCTKALGLQYQSQDRGLRLHKCLPEEC